MAALAAGVRCVGWQVGLAGASERGRGGGGGWLVALVGATVQEGVVVVAFAAAASHMTKPHRHGRWWERLHTNVAHFSW